MAYLNKKQSYALIALCFAVYTTGYIGRLNYSASLVEIISVFQADKAMGGLVSSFFFFAYGAGQLVNGILSKRYNPRIMLTLSLLGAAAVNLLMPFASGLNGMKWLWMVNGIVQSVLWCTIIRTLSVYIPNAILAKASLFMSPTAAIGTFGAYGLSAIGIAMGHWQFVFYVASGLLAGVACLWFFGFGRLKRQLQRAEQDDDACAQAEPAPAQARERKRIHITAYLLLFLTATVAAAVANGFVKDGTVTWTPSIFYEEFGLDKSFSVILTFFLPLVAIFGALISTTLCKKIKSFHLLIAIFYIVSIVCLVLLVTVFLPLKAVVPALLLFIVISCVMAAINNVLTSILPLFFRDKMNSGALAGGINSFCYVGSTLSTVLLGYIADTRGWTAVFITMTVFAAVAFVLVLLAACIRKKETPSALPAGTDEQTEGETNADAGTV